MQQLQRHESLAEVETSGAGGNAQSRGQLLTIVLRPIAFLTPMWDLRARRSIPSARTRTMKLPKFPPVLLFAAASPMLAQADDAVVVTASRSGDEIPQSLIGASVTVVDPAALDERQTRIVSDVLR